MSGQPSGVRRARRWFWVLFLLAVLAMGALYAALGSRPGPATGIAVLITSALLLLSTAQAVRIWLALDRTRRRTHVDEAAGDEGPSHSSGNARTKTQRIFGAPADSRTSRGR